MDIKLLLQTSKATGIFQEIKLQAIQDLTNTITLFSDDYDDKCDCYTRSDCDCACDCERDCDCNCACECENCDCFCRGTKPGD